MEIKSVKYVKDYLLIVYFSNGKIKIADFEPFLRNTRQPMNTAFLDKRKFKKVKVESYGLSWENKYGDAMDFSNESVYNDFAIVDVK